MRIAGTARGINTPARIIRIEEVSGRRKLRLFAEVVAPTQQMRQIAKGGMMETCPRRRTATARPRCAAVVAAGNDAGNHAVAATGTRLG
jgi:hypothetical protein